ncbi:MAG: hypothetical protein GC162_18780 [Planctomycetes bacterium]|nr:hypothetical protein [Planctomycetota bacterium]
MRMCFASLVLCVCAMGAAANGQVIQTGSSIVDGRASVFDIEGAATTYSAAGVTPWTISFAAGSNLQFIFPTITGMTRASADGAFVGPDGGVSYLTADNTDGRALTPGANGIAGAWFSGSPARQMALVGVFYSSTQGGPPAPTVIYDSPSAYNFRSVNPVLNQPFFIGDGSVRFVNDGSSFRFGDGSVRVIDDGTSNTLLISEGSAAFSGSEADGYTATFGDGSVRFIRTGGVWSYVHSDGSSGALNNGDNFAFADGSVRFIQDGTSNTILFGEMTANISGDNNTGWKVTYGDGSVRQLGSSSNIEAPTDGSVRFVSNGSSFRTADGSVRVIDDGTSNTLLLGEGDPVFAGSEADGYTVTFGDGSVRFIRTGGVWSYERSDSTSGTVNDGDNFVFGDGSVRFIRDGSSNTILFGESTADLQSDADGNWSAVLGDGSVRQLGNGQAALFGDGSVRFITDGTSNTVVFSEMNMADADHGGAFYYADGTSELFPPGGYVSWLLLEQMMGLGMILDGTSNTIAFQEFNVPTGADRLTLGFLDSDGYIHLLEPGSYADNGGELMVTYELRHVPEPASILTMLGLLAGLRRRKSR